MKCLERKRKQYGKQLLLPLIGETTCMYAWWNKFSKPVRSPAIIDDKLKEKAEINARYENQEDMEARLKYEIDFGDERFNPIFVAISLG